MRSRFVLVLLLLLLSFMLISSAQTSGANKLPAEISIPGEKIYPESLTSTSDGRVLIGSIGARTIYQVKPGSSTAEPWIKPDNQPGLGILGVFADEKANRLWACFFPMPKYQGTPVQSTLKAFDLKSGALLASYPLPTPGAVCNDIAVGADGTAYVSDTENMEVLRLPAKSSKLEVWAGNGAFGPKGGVLDGISVLGNRLYVNTLETNKLFTIPIQANGKAGAITEVKFNRVPQNPDGMRSFGEDLLIIEGGGAGRLSRIVVNGDSGQITTLKEGYPDGPVSVTVVGENTAYVLEGQLGALFGPPDQKIVAKPFHATSVTLGK